jgi:hypothetical protein
VRTTPSWGPPLTGVLFKDGDLRVIDFVKPSDGDIAFNGDEAELVCLGLLENCDLGSQNSKSIC